MAEARIWNSTKNHTLECWGTRTKISSVERKIHQRQALDSTGKNWNRKNQKSQVEKEKCKENWGQVCALGAKRKSGKTNLQVPSNTEQHNKQAKETTTRLQAGAHIEESKSRNRNKSSGSALRETKIRASIGLQQVRKTGRAEHENERKISGVSSTRTKGKSLAWAARDETPATRTEVSVSRRRMKPHGRQRTLAAAESWCGNHQRRPNQKQNRQRKNSPVHARRKRGKQPKPQIWKQKLATRKTTQENHQKSLNWEAHSSDPEKKQRANEVHDQDTKIDIFLEISKIFEFTVSLTHLIIRTKIKFLHTNVE
jgi:hypothetical protein